MRVTAKALLMLAAAAMPVTAETLRVQTEYYDVSATTLKGLRAEMRRDGPDGYWAYARWWVRWTARCEVSVEIDYTMPRHTDPDALTATDRRKWDRMITALAAHERQHGQFGILAARELEQVGCRNGNAVIEKWAAQDRILDRETDHGRTTGVVLD